MTQGEVLNVLKERKQEWITAEQIIKILKLSNGAVRRSLIQLRKAHFVLMCNKNDDKRKLQYKYNEEDD